MHANMQTYIIYIHEYMLFPPGLDDDSDDNDDGNVSAVRGPIIWTNHAAIRAAKRNSCIVL